MCSLFRQKPLRVRIIHSVYLRKQGASERHSLLPNIRRLQDRNATPLFPRLKSPDGALSVLRLVQSVQSGSVLDTLLAYPIFTFLLHFCSLAP